MFAGLFRSYNKIAKRGDDLPEIKLLEAQEEQFALYRFEGMKKMDAYRKAYPECDKQERTIRKYADRLENKVANRLKELRAEVVQTSKWRLEKVMREFERIYEKCMEDRPVTKFNKYTKELEIIGTTFEFQGAIRCLENIARLQGFYVEKVEQKGEFVIKVIPPDFGGV